jgi:cation:H+ antiporter
MDPTTLLRFAVGMALLLGGAELLVRGASRLARGLGVSPLVIGLTVVAFGTSAPELAVTVGGALRGGPGASIAVGNVVGSNIFNVLFILGLSAAIAPLVVHQRIVQLDVPLMIAASLLAAALGFDGAFGRADGALLFAGIVTYTGFLIRQSRRESAEVRAEYLSEFGADGAPRARGGWLANAVKVAVGLALLVLGARWLVEGAIAFARLLGLSELVIGLTIVAAGTSLPEIATSVLAALRGEREIAVGNVIGSNLFNLLCVLGVAALVAPHGLPVSPAAESFDIPVMVAVSVACLPIFFVGHCLARWEGFLFLGYYAAYVAYLLLDASGHDALPEFRAAMVGFVLPLTIVTLLVRAGRAWRSRRGGGTREGHEAA